MSLLRKTSSFLFRNFAKILTNNHQITNHQRRTIYYLAIQDETEEEMISRYECIFGREDADGWDVRQAMNDLAGYDAIPDPRIVIAGLQACRRLNDYALSVRFLEMVKDKCGNRVNEVYPYIVQEVGDTVAELGCDFPETLGYDQPEMFLPDEEEWELFYEEGDDEECKKK